MLYLGTTKSDKDVVYDDKLSTVSENAVQNKIITKRLDELESLVNNISSSINSTITNLMNQLDLFKIDILHQIDTKIADLAKIDGSNLSYSHLIESGEAKTSDGNKVFYRKYSDGWCEQWGNAGSVDLSSTKNKTNIKLVNLYFQYKNTEYLAFVTGACDANSDEPLWIQAKTFNSFNVYKTTAGASKGTDVTQIYWYTAGFLFVD